MLQLALLNKIEKFLNPNEDINLRGIPANDDEILKAEEVLGLKFDDDYKTFIKTFGGAYAGIAIYGFKNNAALSSETVVDLTLDFRDSYANDERGNIFRKALVVSDDNSGNPILITEEGKVVIVYHDSDDYKTLASSFSAFIEKSLNGNLWEEEEGEII
jgi:SMI1-KNR4 cell-wall